MHICPTPLHSLTWQATQSHIAASSDDWQVHGHGQVSGQATQFHMAASSSSGLGAAMPAQPQVTSGGNVAQQADLAPSTATMESWNLPNEETY